MKKLIASAVTAALILLTPGFEFYASAADFINTPEMGARATPVTPVVPQLGMVPTNLDLLKGPQGLPINGAPIALPEGISGANPAIQAASAQSASAKAAEAAKSAATAQPVVAAQAQLTAAGAKASASNQSLKNQGGEASAKSTSDAAFDNAVVRDGATADPVAGSESAAAAAGSGLDVFRPEQGGGSIQPPAPPSRGDRGPSDNGPRGFGSKLFGFVKSVALIGGAAALVIGLQAGGAALLPAVFGLVPEAAVWSVASGVLPPLLLTGVYARYRLAKRDSPRLNKVKVLLDVSIGAFVGALAIAAPSFSIALAAQGMTRFLPIAAAGALGTFAAKATEGSAVNTLMGGFTLMAVPALLGAAAHGAIGLGPIAGMLALPAIVTVSFFLGSIINSAETGRPFSVPGSMQKMRFPSFNWVMIGVVFALVTGYSAVYTNFAFMAWMMLGNKDKSQKFADMLLPQTFFKGTKLQFQTPGLKIPPAAAKLLNFVLDFDHLFVGLAAFAALTGFHTPLTFLVLAFAPERAAVWTERLLGRFLPASKPAPSSNGGLVDESSFSDKLETKIPNYHHWIKTGVILAVMAGSVALGAFTLFGAKALITSAIPAAILTFVPLFFVTKLIKLMMKAETATTQNMPKPYFDAYMRVTDKLIERINAKRKAAGRKAIPMPERTRVPMDVPNAFATGRDPNHALIGVTDGIMDMLLEPENVRDQLGRLMVMFKDRPDDPKFKVFRRAIAGSLKNVGETATPLQVSQAVQRADAEQLRELGERMLAGVISHEFSHVMDRHMLTGSIAGFFASLFAYASYGIMWGVGHAQVAAKKLKDKILGKSEARQLAERSEDVTGKNGTNGAKTEVVEPISTAVALKSLPALLKVLAALWGPVILQITQMAGSRNNEAQADFDGALLSQDPESLALALGMLMTWQPKNQFFIFRGRRFDGKQLPLLAAVAPMFTVNPLEQLSGVGLKNELAGKADNFLFNLFVTHPDTGWRIETLFRISEGMRAQQRAKLKDGGGGNNSPPLAYVAPLRKNAPAQSRGGSFQGAWGKLLGFFRVLPDKDRNAQFWKFVWGQALINVGISFYYSVLGKLADPSDNHPERVSYNRAANAGAQLGSSLLTGPMVDRASTQKVLQYTYLGRALFLLAIPTLFFLGHGVMPFLAFQLLMVGASFLQSTSGTAASVAFNRILGQDTASYNRANAIYNVVTGVAGIAAPLAAGVFIAAMNARYGLLSGNALSYLVYGAMMLGVAWLFRTLKLPRDDLLQARRDLAVWLKSEHKAGRLSAARGVSTGVEKGQPVLQLELKGQLAVGEAAPAEFGGYPVRVVAARNVTTELLSGFRSIFTSRFLTYYLAFSTLASMMSDPLVFSVLGKYVKTGITHIGVPSFAAQIPWVASLIVDFTKTPEALFGFYMAAASLGSVLASFLMIWMRDNDSRSLDRAAGRFQAALAEKGGVEPEQVERAGAAVREAVPDVLDAYRKSGGKPASAEAFGRDVLARALRNLNADSFGGAKSQAELEELARTTGLADGLAAWSATKDAEKTLKSGLTQLERQGRWTSILHGLGWLLFFGVFGTGNLWLSTAAMVAAEILQGPAMSVWGSLVTEAMRRNYRQQQGKIYSALSFYSLVFAIIGPFLFGGLLTYAAKHPSIDVMAIALAAVTLMAVLDVWQAWKNFPMETRRRTS